MVGGRQSPVMAGYWLAEYWLVLCPLLGVCHNLLVFPRVLFNFIEKSMQILFLKSIHKKIGPHLECFSSVFVESFFTSSLRENTKNLNDRIERN